MSLEKEAYLIFEKTYRYTKSKINGDNPTDSSMRSHLQWVKECYQTAQIFDDNVLYSRRWWILSLRGARQLEFMARKASKPRLAKKWNTIYFAFKEIRNNFKKDEKLR